MVIIPSLNSPSLQINLKGYYTRFNGTTGYDSGQLYLTINVTNTGKGQASYLNINVSDYGTYIAQLPDTSSTEDPQDWSISNSLQLQNGDHYTAYINGHNIYSGDRATFYIVIDTNGSNPNGFAEVPYVTITTNATCNVFSNYQYQIHDYTANGITYVGYNADNQSVSCSSFKTLD